MEALRNSATLANDLRGALHDGYVHLCYQPIYDTVTGRPIAFEALAGAIRSAAMYLPPNSFPRPKKAASSGR
jgi:predicted signal transduction protein with EAL and GGDEF domain